MLLSRGRYLVQLEGTDHTYFQELIGILRWATELGRIDVMVEVSMLSTHLAMPRNGHLEQAIHIFAYMTANPKKTLAMDPQHPVYNEDQFLPVSDWHDFYRDAKEQIPDDSSPSRGKWYPCTVLLMQIMPAILLQEGHKQVY
jgi:hypothetical protein